jgi:hypothetical protein
MRNFLQSIHIYTNVGIHALVPRRTNGPLATPQGMTYPTYLSIPARLLAPPPIVAAPSLRFCYHPIVVRNVCGFVFGMR